ncbi:MAG: PRD domain-containing protein [Clostridium baratii]|uniref:BglG family transcription antiterminator LicT n=1 Tax=Clostridium baratii TaxID=1561 RepID=UPI0006DC2F06|nr:PRD domain-containing protein [Clostridium baratii]MBS6007931.1 PRD domain-containing protein [Clostridium baratii]MDU1055155.1 PRD domain-containing protein [Clostridium baratii]
MRIEKILNNNVVTSINDNNEEIIVMGRGIAFKKRVKDIIVEKNIEKIFTLSNPNINNKFIELISSIPLEYTVISEKIIGHAKEKTGKKFNESIYISLTDHIYNAIERHRQGIVVTNGLSWETKRLYSEEYELGLEALEIIRKEFDIYLAEDEAAFIALHFVNANLNEEMPMLIEITKLIQEILNIVKYNFNIEFDLESLAYYRFITHLKFFAQRFLNNKINESDEENDLFYIIKDKYNEAYKCVMKIQKFILEKYKYGLSQEEMLYLIIHIQKLISKN